MRALIHATGVNPALMPLNQRHPTPLFRIVDKPILVHIIERLVLFGIRQFDIVICHLPHLIEECLNDGQRWGISVTYHLAREPDFPFAAVVPAASNWSDELILLGHAEILPKIHPKQLKGPVDMDPMLFFHGKRGWIGWGVLSTKSLQRIDRKMSFPDLPQHLERAAQASISGVLLSVRNLHDWQTSNHRVLTTHAPRGLFPSTARMVEPGIWISRAAVLHPTAVLKAPVFIGENCQIMAEAQIGPDVVVENHCIIDKGSTIARSLICQESYVGEGLEVYNDIIDQRTLVNLAIGATVDITDDFILCHVAPPRIQRYAQKAVERMVAFLLLLIVAPGIAWMAWFRGISASPVVQLPAPEESHSWTTFPLLQSGSSRLPGLLNIVRGELHFIGVSPRSIQEMEALNPEWRHFAIEGKAGWFTAGEASPSTDPFVAEAFYVTHQGFLEDCKILWSIILSTLWPSIAYRQK